MVLKERRKGALYIIILAAVLIGLVMAAGAEPAPFGGSKVNSPQELSEFLQSLGWECDLSQLTEQNAVLPEQFDDTFIAYNAIQLEQGCDLSKFAGKAVVVYTVPLTNYTRSTDTVLATVIVYKGNVIGGDIHAAAMDGFMHSLT